jgi:hypothetical protein
MPKILKFGFVFQKYAVHASARLPAVVAFLSLSSCAGIF